MNNKIEVTVICMTYNHEKYIEDALKGFVMQKTNFSFKVIIHDDASTDGTKSIIEKYARDYDFIQPIFEDENQSSKGVRFSEMVYPYIEGKYFAYCDGDDYWIDPLKLQKQFDFMEANSDCVVCGHSYLRKNMANGFEETIYIENNNGVVDVSTIIDSKSLHINTLMVRMGIFDDIPEFFNSIKTVGDWPLMLFCATKGKICCLNDIMSCYRLRTENSWTNRVFEHKINSIVCLNDMCHFLKEYDIYTDTLYHESVEKRLDELEQIIKNNLEFLNEMFEKSIENEKIIKNYKEQVIEKNSIIENNEKTINDYKKQIVEKNNIMKNNGEIINNSTKEINNLLKCKPYKIASIIHNLFSRIKISNNIMQNNVDIINDSVKKMME